MEDEIVRLKGRITEIEKYMKEIIVLTPKDRGLQSELACLKENVYDLEKHLKVQKEKKLKELIIEIEDVSILIGKTKMKISELKHNGNIEVAKKQEKYLYTLEQKLIDLKIEKLTI